MEENLHAINRYYIALPQDEVKRNKDILELVLDEFVSVMKSQSPLFKAMYRRKFYGGSFYDGLRVGHPTEFDLDLLLDIPKLTKPTLTLSNVPGYIHLQAKEIHVWMKQPKVRPTFENFEKLLFENCYLSTSKVLHWMESIVSTSLNTYSYNKRTKAYKLSNYMGDFEIKFYNSGPAATLNITGAGVDFDVDIVPCFVFGKKKWPESGFKKNPVASKPEFFIVPKEFKKDHKPQPRYWRLSFQEQERVLLKNKHRLKPTIRLLKKLRDNQEHKLIASYYIKTVALHIVDREDDSFWHKPLSHVFMTMLKEYRDFIKNESIPYYWYPKNNLIGHIESSTLQNFSGRLSAIIRDIENNPDDFETLRKYFGSDIKADPPAECYEEERSCSIL